MAIEETIDVGVAGLSSVDALAGALDKAAGSAAKLRESLGSMSAGGGGAGGIGKMASSMNAAAAKIETAVGKIEAALGRLDGLGAGAAASLSDIGAAAADSAAGLGDAAKSANSAATAYGRLGKASAESAAAMDGQALAGSRVSKATKEGAASSEKFWKGVKVAAVGGAVAVGYGIDQAMKLQTQVTRLYTAAGLKGVKPSQVDKDVLSIGSKTGFSGTAIAEAMYHPVSAGLDYKTSKGLTEQAANLANVHGASLDDTTYALSSVLKAYNKGAKDVVPTAALLNSIVGQGDMKFQDLNESIKNFAPTGASMGISLQSMGAGLAYLTDRGNSAEVASTRLTMGLGMATAGSKAANTYMRDLGLTTGSLDLKNKSLQKTMEAGGLTTNKFAADLKKPDGLYVALSDMQGAFTKAGLSSQQADTVMAKIFGGGRSDKAIVSLMQNLGGVKQKYDQIGEGVKNYGKSVAGEQDTAQQKWKDFLASSQNLAAGFGNTMLPTFTKIAGAAANLLQGDAGKATAGVLGGALALFTGKKLFSGVESAAGTLGKVGKFLNIPGLSKLSGVGQAAGADVAASGLTAVGGAADAAAASLGRLSGVAAEEGITGGAGGVGRGAGAVAAEEEAAGGLGGLLKTGAGGVLAGGLVAAIAIPLAMQADKALQKHLGSTQASGYAQVGVGAAAGAATGAAAGSVIPGLGTAVGAIAGALIGGVTTAMRNPKVWDEIAGAPKAPGKTTAAPAPHPVWQIPGTGGSQLPVLKTPPAKNPTWGWAIANAVDQKRHATAAGFDRARHDSAVAADWIGGSYDTTRHQAAGFGQTLAEMFGYKPPPKPSNIPQAAPHQWQSVTGTGGYYPNGQPFFGEVNQRPAAPRISATPTAPGKLAALSQPVNIKPIKLPAPDTSAVTAAMAKLKLLNQPQNIKPIKIPAPDVSAVGAAKGKLAALSQPPPIKPAKIPAPDTSALDGAKGKAASAGTGITQAIQGAMHPAKMPPPDLSAASGAAGQAQGIGANISAGLAAGIRSGIGAIQAAAAAAAAAASVAMAHTAQTHSPSKVTEKTGKDIAQGLVVGLEGGTDAVKAASTALGSAATKPPDITSIDNTIAKLKKQVSGKPAMVMWLEGEQDQLTKLAAKRAKLETEITNSEQAAKSAISGASIMNSLNAVNPAGNEPIASSAIVQGQQYQASSMQQFAKSLLQLQKQGLNATSLSQIAQAGPDQGLGMAQGIASGGKQAITQLNQLQKQMKGYASQIGDVTGTAMYQSGQDIGAGLAAGLKAALKADEKDIEKTAKQAVGIVDKVSGGAKAKAKKAAAGTAGSSSAASPSGAASGSAGSVTATAGSKSLAAAASSLSTAGSSLSAAASALSSAASALGKAGPGGGSPSGGAKGGGGHLVAPTAPGGGGYGGGGGGPYLPVATTPRIASSGGDVHVHLHVAGNAMVDKDWAKQMQTILLQKAERNLGTGMQLRGRGT